MVTKSSRKGRARRAGLTLVESVIGLMVFSGFIGGACKLVVLSHHVGDRAAAHYAAVNIAKTRIERIKTFGFNQFELCQESGIVLNRSGRPDNNGNFRLTTTVVSRGEGLKDVTVRVDIRNPRTLAFDGEHEQIASSLADLQEPPRG